MIRIVKSSLDDEIHLKGYIYDSLMYRYMMAREKMALYDWENRCKYNHAECNRRTYEEAAKRDMIRFAQILDEAIGEHD